ncbi:hypothetical protein GGF42_002321 [Coemansia sp. RSA 2424]|nr:hypothetical protein GGF42_002321 [Coemansia sp. RSA 2424]
MPLLWVCRNFRAIVYSHYCTRCWLELCDESNEVKSFWNCWPECLQEIVYPAHDLARELYIKVEAWDVFNGKLSQALSHAPCNGCSFPRARLVKLYFDSREHHDISRRRLSTIRENISEFVDRLLQMAPSACKIDLYGLHVSWHLPEPAKPYFAQLVLQLFQNYKRVSYSVYTSDKLTSCQVNTIRDLVDLNYSINDDCSNWLQLVRQSESTLQSLVIYLSKVVDISPLIQHADGSYAEYPCLHTLELRNDLSLDFAYDIRPNKQRRTKRDIARLPVFHGAVPFPRLRHLRIQIDYPFGDDTLFRGSATTLEYLDLQLMHTLIDRIKKCKVFTPTSHPKLQYVKINKIDNHKMPNFRTAEAYLRFALSIAPHAQVRKIEGLPFGDEFQSVPLLFDGYSDIRILSLSGTCVRFWDVVALINSLPNLEYLVTDAPTLGPMPKGVSFAKLPAYVLSKYAPMSERFRRWHSLGCRLYEESEVAKCVLLLALLCPNFDYIDPFYYEIPTFMQHMNRIAAMQGFKKHKQRLQRLLVKH